MSRDAEAFVDVSAASNVLLLASPMEAASDEACVDLLNVEPPGGTSVLWVTLTQTPDHRLRRWRKHAGDDLPAELFFADFGSGAGDVEPSSTIESARGGSITVEVVVNPANLTRLGVVLSDRLDAWDGTGRQTTLCFDSLTALLQHVELQPAYRFLMALTKRVAETGGIAHYHLDPAAHDERTVRTVTSLFDAVMKIEGDGERQVTVR